MEKWGSKSERWRINVFIPAFCRHKGQGSLLEASTQNTEDLSWCRGTAALLVTQRPSFYARLYFAVTENCALQLCYLQRIGSIMCAGVWGIPKQWGKQPSSPACGVHRWVLTERSKVVYHTAAQQWINFLPKLKVAAGPLCLTAMKGLKHAKFIYFLYLFTFESLTPWAPQYLLAIEFSLMA